MLRDTTNTNNKTQYTFIYTVICTNLNQNITVECAIAWLRNVLPLPLGPYNKMPGLTGIFDLTKGDPNGNTPNSMQNCRACIKQIKTHMFGAWI